MGPNFSGAAAGELGPFCGVDPLTLQGNQGQNIEPQESSNKIEFPFDLRSFTSLKAGHFLRTSTDCQVLDHGPHSNTQFEPGCKGVISIPRKLSWDFGILDSSDSFLTPDARHPEIMAKKIPGVPNRHLYSRISFLYQAAAYLSEASRHGPESTSQGAASHIKPVAAGADIMDWEHDVNDHDHDQGQDPDNLQDSRVQPVEIAAGQSMPRKLLTDLRAVAQKSQIRISPAIKRTICKYCDTLLVDGHTCSSTVENRSKGGKKPWADVLVIKCHTCGRTKRFPVNAQRQKRRPYRASVDRKGTERDAAPTQHPTDRLKDC